ncbi:MAG: helix-turn-helix domain-containing protein [Bacteroidota bacterium]
MGNRRYYENPLDCPVTRTVNILGGRWKSIILYCLSGGKLRFGQLAAYIPTISRKVLTNQLRELEADKLITRKEFNEIPPRVEYEISDLGKSVFPILEVMKKWGENEGLQIEEFNEHDRH